MMSASDDVYRVDNVASYYEDDSSDDEVEEMMILAQQQQGVPTNNMKRPPPISTGGFDTSIIDEDDGEEEGEEVVISDFLQPDRHVHFQDPKRSHQTPPYPVQSLRTTAMGHEEQDASNGIDATPAFLRRAAKDNMNDHGNTSHIVNPQPPNTLPMLRENNNTQNNNDMPDSSFYGADASALDGTFVSIRDLNDDDDVPSIDNDNWNPNSTFDRQSDASSGFPTETTSLLQQHQQNQQQRNRKNNNGKQLPWQGGFFGSQVEKEDRRERRKLNQKRGWFHGLIGQLGSNKNENHPTGDDFTPRRQNNTNFHKPYYQPRSPLSFSTLLTCALCFHIGLCGIHDLFMRYLSYRNPNDSVEVESSWNGEGTYIPAYWFSADGRIHNPLIGPGARTLTAFGALVPGLVISKGQIWRMLTALFETASCLQLVLQVWVLKMIVGGSTIRFERTRGTLFVTFLYLLSALVGTVWSMAIEPGRLITASEMGTAGLLAGAIVQQLFTSESKKDDDDALQFEGQHGQRSNGNANGSNMMATASNEQFTFQPVAPKKKRMQYNIHSPFLLMVLQIILSWLSAYSSLIGTIAACGASCALLLLVGAAHNGSSHSTNNDLLFSESVEPPPPPPSRFDEDGWNDDESTDTSVGAGKQVFHTPLMRRSILADDDDEEEPLGSRSSLRKRKGGIATSSSAPRGLNMNVYSGRRKPINAYQVLARLIGILMAILLTLIPIVLIASSGNITNELTRAAVLGCKPMRIVYQGDSGEDTFECAGGCVPLSLVRVARRKESMKAGRCDDIAYRCWQQAGTMTLRNYEVEVGIYSVQNAGGNCNSEGDANQNNYSANDGEADNENENENEGKAQNDAGE